MRFSALLALFICFFSAACAQSPKGANQSALDSAKREIIMLADLKISPNSKDITKYKAEAAINLALVLSGKYYMVPAYVRDSIALELKKDSIEANVKNVAERLKVKKLLFANVSRLNNMIRVQLTRLDSIGAKPQNGAGYANLRFKKDTSFVVDPSLLSAAQRALAEAEDDSLMFAKLEGELQVYPHPNIVAGGLEFRDDPTVQGWKLFEDKVVTSFDAAEVMFEELVVKNSGFVPYDIDTRDSIYALFKFFIPENYRAPSVNELNALERLEVSHYATGTFTRNDEGAEIKIMICRLKGSKLYPIKTETAILKEDSIIEFRNKIREIMAKLLKN